MAKSVLFVIWLATEAVARHSVTIEDMENQSKPTSYWAVPSFMGIGMALGSAAGLQLGNAAQGVAVGCATGIVLGLLFVVFRQSR